MNVVVLKEKLKISAQQLSEQLSKFWYIWTKYMIIKKAMYQHREIVA